MVSPEFPRGTKAEGIVVRLSFVASCLRRKAERINHVWSYDFVSDRTADGRSLKLLVVLDEYTRESLTIEVERSIRAEAVRNTLEYLFAIRGSPQYLRSDNGPEFVATTIQEWLKQSGVDTLYIASGSPWENAYIESFNSRLRDELLNTEVFGNLREAKVLVEDYRRRYNHHRPHSSLHYATPEPPPVWLRLRFRRGLRLRQTGKKLPTL